MSLSLSRLADIVDPPAAPSPFEALGYEPTCLPRWAARKQAVPLPPPCGKCPQELFHSATEDRVLYGGAAGGGKTKALVMEAIRLAVIYPGMTVGIFRKSWPELRKTVIKEFRRVAFCKALGATYNASEMVLRFPNGSEIICGFLDTESDATKYQGAEYQAILIDELTLIKPEVVDMLLERFRSADPRCPVVGLRASANPGDIGHADVKARFIVPTEHGAKVHTETEVVNGEEVSLTYRFIPAKVRDNPYIGNYEATLSQTIRDPARRKRMLDGDWSAYSGQVFDEWNHDLHVVTPFPVPKEWERYSGIDFGYAMPFACMKVAVDGDGRGWVYGEITGTKVGQTEQAMRVLASEADDPQDQFGALVQRYADPSMWNKTSEHESIAEAYIRAGCYIQPAVNDRVSGWQRLHELLSLGPACPLHRELAERGEWDVKLEDGTPACPMLLVFDTCKRLIDTLPDLPRNPHKPEDVLKCSTDHWADALRYCVMAIRDASAPTLASIWA